MTNLAVSMLVGSPPNEVHVALVEIVRSDRTDDALPDWLAWLEAQGSFEQHFADVIAHYWIKNHLGVWQRIGVDPRMIAEITDDVSVDKSAPVQLV